MSEDEARTIANLYGGRAVQWIIGCDQWQVFVERESEIVVFHDDAICEYMDQDAFDIGEETVVIELA